MVEFAPSLLYEQSLATFTAMRNYTQTVATNPVSPGVAQSLQTFMGIYPQFSPGVALSFAQSGRDVSDPIVSTAYQYDTAANAGPQLGDQIPKRRKQPRRGPFMDTVNKMFDQWQEQLNTTDRKEHDRIIDKIRSHPDQLTSLFTKLRGVQLKKSNETGGFAGVRFDLPEPLNRYNAFARNPPKSDISVLSESNIPVVSQVATGAKAVVRGAAVGAQSLYEAGVAAQRAAGTAGGGGSEFLGLSHPDPQFLAARQRTWDITRGGPFRAIAEQTSAYQAAATGDFGTGVLGVGPSAAQAQAEASRLYSPHIYREPKTASYNQIKSGQVPGPSSAAINIKRKGDLVTWVEPHAWTIGRGTADIFFEPDDNGFQLLSGAVDASYALSKLDPASATLSELGKANQARKTFASPLARAEAALGEQTPALTFKAPGGVEAAARANGPVTGAAVWRNAATDQPVFVTGLAGEADGRQYVNIRGSNTAVPRDEVTFIGEEAGAHRGLRNWLSPQDPERWYSTQGKDFFQKIIDEKPSALTLKHAVPGWDYMLKDGKTPFIQQIVDAARQPGATADDLWDIFKPYAGTEFRGVPTLKSRVGYEATMGTRNLGETAPAIPTIRAAGISNTRAFTAVPGEKAFLDSDWNTAAATIDEHLVNARVPAWKREQVMSEVAKGGGIGQREASLRISLDAIKESLIANGLDEKTATDWTRYVNNEHMDAAHYFGTIAANPGPNPPHIDIGAERIIIGEQPGLETELLHVASMPNARAVKRVVSDFNRITNTSFWSNTVTMGDLAMAPWRRLVLTRPAWGLRVVAEEQARIAAAGLTSLYNHPLSMISLVLGNTDTRVQTWLSTLETKPITRTALGAAIGGTVGGVATGSLQGAAVGATIGGTVGYEAQQAFQKVGENLAGRIEKVKAQLERGPVGVGGQSLEDAISEGEYARFYAVRGSKKLDLYDYDMIPSHHAKAAQGIAEEITRARTSKMMRAIFDAENPQAYRDWFWEGAGKALREDLATKEGYEYLATKAGSDAHMDGLNDAWRRVANNDAELMDAYRTGEFRGLNLTARDKHDDIVTKFQDFINEGRAPANVRIRRYLTLTDTDKTRVANNVVNGMNWLFDFFMPRPSNFFSRNPTLRQFYWKRAEELFPYMRSADREFVLNELHQANLGDITNARFAQMHTRLGQIEDEYGNLPIPSLFTEPSYYSKWAQQTVKTVGKKPWLMTQDEFASEIRRLQDRIPWTEMRDEYLARAKDSPLRKSLFDAGYSTDQVDDFQRLAYLGGDGKPFRTGANWDLISPGRPHEDISAAWTDTAGLHNDWRSWAHAKSAPTWDQVHHLSADYAVSETKNLLYDLSERGQLSDTLRLVVPFGEAWREIITRWAKLIHENPAVLRRMQQILNGAHQSGLFHTDPQTGDEVFGFAGSEWLTNKLIGVPIPLQGRVQGLNLIGNGLPGVGPVAQVPAGWLIPDTPNAKFVNDIIFPYGEHTTGNPFKDIEQQYVPSWAQKVISGFNDPDTTRTLGNTTFDVARYLASTGEYNLHGPDAVTEASRLMRDAKSKAKWFTVIRGFAQSTLPTSPSPEWQVVDKQGRLTLAWKIADQYQKQLEKTNDPGQALSWLLDRYGIDNLFLSQAKSKAVIPAPPNTPESDTWRKRHPEIVASYPTTYSLFGPAGVGFDQAAYEKQFKRGERVKLTPEQMVSYSNARLATQIYHNRREVLEADGKRSTRDDAELRLLDRQLISEFPGYAEPQITSSPTKVLMVELERAAADPRLRRNPAAKALNEYLAQRAQVAAQAARMKLAWPSDAALAQPLRTRLTIYGENLVEKYPQFGPLWRRVLSREVD